MTLSVKEIIEQRLQGKRIRLMAQNFELVDHRWVDKLVEGIWVSCWIDDAVDEGSWLVHVIQLDDGKRVNVSDHYLEHPIEIIRKSRRAHETSHRSQKS